MQTGMRQGPEIWIRGPVATQEPGPPEPAHAHAAARRFSWVGTHGGAGVSTLAAVYGGHDSGRAWPGPGDPASVLLVARTHAAGLDTVAGAVEIFRRGQAPPGWTSTPSSSWRTPRAGCRVRSPSGSGPWSRSSTCTACRGCRPGGWASWGIRRARHPPWYG